MPIPEGIDSTYVWCLLWFGIEAALAALVDRLRGSKSEEVQASSRTYRRLGPLNAHLNDRIESAWARMPSDDVVADLPALLDLSREVSRALSVYRIFVRRRRLLTAALVIVLCECTAPFLFAGVLFLTSLREELFGTALAVFAVGTGLAVASLAAAGAISARIDAGDD